jgi:formylglycine-generating enzyme required for sulfatase activity
MGDNAAWVGREEKPVTPAIVAGRRRANPFGLFDMHGNVWEICQDVFDPNAYKTAPPEDPVGPGGMGLHVNRGGAADRPALSSYSALRIPNRMGQTGNMTGFRVLKEF